MKSWGKLGKLFFQFPWSWNLRYNTLQVNGVLLSGKTHDDAVQILHSTKGSAVLVIEQNAESRVLNVQFSSSSRIFQGCKFLILICFKHKFWDFHLFRSYFFFCWTVYSVLTRQQKKSVVEIQSTYWSMKW